MVVSAVFCGAALAADVAPAAQDELTTVAPPLAFESTAQTHPVLTPTFSGEIAVHDLKLPDSPLMDVLPETPAVPGELDELDPLGEEGGGLVKIPEPGTLAALALAVLMMWVWRRRW